jgi:hypothetical protein
MKDSSHYSRSAAPLQILWIAAALVAIGCSPSRATPVEHRDAPALAASVSGPPVASALPAPHKCCVGNQEVQHLDGVRVVIVGHYAPIQLSKRIVGKPDGGQAGPLIPSMVAIETSYGQTFMLELYYGPSGVRPLDEITRFAGKRVEIVGTLHARTPPQQGPDGEAQTMTGPYVGEIESIREAP